MRYLLLTLVLVVGAVGCGSRVLPDRTRKAFDGKTQPFGTPLVEIDRCGVLPRLTLEDEYGDGGSVVINDGPSTYWEFLLAEDGNLIWSTGDCGYGEPYRHAVVPPRLLEEVVEVLRPIAQVGGDWGPGLHPGGVSADIALAIGEHRRGLASAHEGNPPGCYTSQRGTGTQEFFQPQNWTPEYQKFRADWDVIRRVCAKLIQDCGPGRPIDDWPE